MQKQKYSKIQIANGSDYKNVAILFTNRVITKLFSQLLESKGISVTAINSIQELSENEKLITEPLFFNKLTNKLQKHCLLLSSKEEKNSAGVCLTQPLTEQKIEVALSQFLAN